MSALYKHIRIAPIELSGVGQTDEEALARMVWMTISEASDPIRSRLIAEYGAAGALCRVLDEEDPDEMARQLGLTLLSWMALVDAVGTYRKALDAGQIRRDLAHAKKLGARLLVPGDGEFPDSVADLDDDAPVGFWAYGPHRLDPSANRVAVVGSRIATSYGDWVTDTLVQGLADSSQNVDILSGAGYGIDGTAQDAAMLNQAGAVTVLANGIAQAYPVGQRQLISRIARRGLLLSPLPLNAKPSKVRFQHRGDILAGLADSIVVVEAGYRSGALGVATRAERMNRWIGAVPGPITSPASAGTHQLIKNGNHIVTGGVDIDLPR